MESIGVLGLGRMGLPIARRLLAAGLAVTAFDTEGAAVRRAREAGVPTATSARELAQNASILVTVLPGPAEVRSALDDDGLLEALRTGSCWLDLTSNDPRVATRLATRASELGVDAVGAPMAGNPDDAATGSLGFFVGGQAHAIERIMPVLSELASSERISVMSPDVGAGYTAKLLANTLWFGQALAVTEMLLLGKAAGLDLGTLRRVLEGSAGGSAFISRHLDALLAGDYLETFGIDRVVEELDTVTELGEQLGVAQELTALVARLHREALSEFGPVPGELLGAKLLELRSGTALRA